MFVCVATMDKIKTGELVILKWDNQMGAVCACTLGGGAFGYVAVNQPEGCVKYDNIKSGIGDNRILGYAVICTDNAVVVQSDSKLFETVKAFGLVEKAGNLMLC